LQLATNTGITIGISSGGSLLFLAAIVGILSRRWKKRIQKRLRRRYFRKKKGILLEQLIVGEFRKTVTLETSSLTKFLRYVFQEQGIHDFRES
jgi:hypothetical protein